MDDPAILPATQFKNRRIGLIIFGLLTLLAGCCCAFLVPLAVIGLQLAAKSPHPPPAAPNIIPIVVLYGALAVILVWLGIGSILARRWARALLVIWSWSLLIVGTVAVAVLVLMAPRLAASVQAAAQTTGQPKLSDAARTAMIFVPAVVMTVIMVIVPLVWALFYGGKNVKATCEALNPVPGWTDRCPLPVLAMSLWLAFSAFTTLLMPAFHSVAPFFGLLLSGAAGTAFYLCHSFVWAYGGWRIYRLDARGLWIIAAAIVLFGLSTFITYSWHDLDEVYALMGYPPGQAAQLREIGLMGKNTMAWSSFLFTVPILGYLWYIRKFFNVEKRTGLAIENDE